MSERRARRTKQVASTAEQRRIEEDRQFLLAMGWRVRMRRRALEMSQQELATAAGMSRNFVSSVERGAHGVDAVRVRRIAEALGVDIAVLVSLTAWNRAAGEALPGMPTQAVPKMRSTEEAESLEEAGTRPPYPATSLHLLSYATSDPLPGPGVLET